MTSSTAFASCSGCFPIYQPNQLAHCEPGGCLFCDFQEDNDELIVEGSLDSLFGDSSEEDFTSENIKKEKDDNECCICYDTIDSQKNNCTTECGHKFCFKCLATSLVHNNFACPCCRTQLVESSEESDEDSDNESESLSDEEENENYDDRECDIDELNLRLKSNGFKMKDILAMLLGRYNKDMSDLSVYELNQKFDALVDESDNEVIEQSEMGKEDFRSREVVIV
jgi:hypothetical protein